MTSEIRKHYRVDVWVVLVVIVIPFSHKTIDLCSPKASLLTGKRKSQRFTLWRVDTNNMGLWISIALCFGALSHKETLVWWMTGSIQRDTHDREDERWMLNNLHIRVSHLAEQHNPGAMKKMKDYTISDLPCDTTAHQTACRVLYQALSR